MDLQHLVKIYMTQIPFPPLFSKLEHKKERGKEEETLKKLLLSQIKNVASGHFGPLVKRRVNLDLKPGGSGLRLFHCDHKINNLNTV